MAPGMFRIYLPVAAMGRPRGILLRCIDVFKKIFHNFIKEFLFLQIAIKSCVIKFKPESVHVFFIQTIIASMAKRVKCCNIVGIPLLRCVNRIQLIYVFLSDHYRIYA